MPYRLLLLLLAFFYQPELSAQSADVERLIDTTIVIIKANSLNASKVDWVQLRKEIALKTKTMKHPYELGDVFRDMFRRINEFHGFISVADSQFRWVPKPMVIPDSIANEWKKTVYLVPQLVSDNIGYMRIPGMSFSSREDANAKAQNLNDSLCYLLSQGIKGLVLDLRLNGGGAMHPMLLGMEQLLGGGVIGSFRGKTKEDWKLVNHSFVVDADTVVSIKPVCNIKATAIPVVIITSSQTGSSGEFFVIAFKGRKNTIQLGQPTSGFNTVIKEIVIDDYSWMRLSVGVGADRNGHVYTSALAPDIPLEAVDKFNDLKSDAKVQAAINWLNKRSSTASKTISGRSVEKNE